MRLLRSERRGSANPMRWLPVRAALPGLLLALLLFPATVALSGEGPDSHGARPPSEECIYWAVMLDGGGLA